MATSTDYDYARFTALDNTGRFSIFKSAYKNIRFALPATSNYTIDASDLANLAGIAYKVYGDVSLWRLILAFNGIQDPIQDLFPGLVLKLPSKPGLISYLNEQLHSKQETIVI